MTTLRITGVEPNVLKVHHTLYLRRVVGLRLSVAKSITDDVLEGIAREIEVPEALAEVHLKTLRLLGARVEAVSGAREAPAVPLS